MASYKIVPLRTHDDIDREALENGLERHSALKTPDPRDVEGADPRRGPLPYTLQSFGKGIHFFEFGYQDEETTTDLEGNERQSIYPVRRQVVFLGNGYLAADARCANDVQTEILYLVSSMLGTEIVLEPVEFDDDTLRDVIDRAEKVEQADFDPATAGMPDKVSGKNRSGLRDTQLWTDIGEEPIEKVRVNLPDKRVEKRVGFKDDGVVTIYGQNIAPKLSSSILRHITDEVVSNLESETFQQRLGGVNP